MSNEIFRLFMYAMDFFGLFLVMCGMKRLKELIDKKKDRAKNWTIFCVLFFLNALTAKGLGRYWSLAFAAEYGSILIWEKKRGEKIYPAVWKGSIGIVAMLLTELLILMIYYYKGVTYSLSEVSAGSEIQILCGLAIAMTQFFLVFFLELRRMVGRFQKALMITLGIQALEDLIWLYVCIVLSLVERNYSLIIALFSLAAVINYMVLFMLRIKSASASEQQKRAEIHRNTYEYYLNMEEEHLQIRKMYHEMKNQLMILREGEKEMEQFQQSKEAIAERLEKISRFYHTGQPSLDMLLFETRMRAESHRIEFEAVIAEGCLNFMAEDDVTIIFSNGIINAIEACEKIVDGPRKITIKAGENSNDTLIYIKNSVSRDRQKGSLNTNKKNKIAHGIGMGSIQECVEKYHGYISIIEEEGSFQLAILFGRG